MLPPSNAHRHEDGFGGASAAVIHRGVGDLHAGELADHGLKFEDGLQGPLRDLRLIWRIGGENIAALSQLIDDDRTIVLIISRAEKDCISGGVLFAALAKEVDDL